MAIKIETGGHNYAPRWRELPHPDGATTERTAITMIDGIAYLPDEATHLAAAARRDGWTVTEGVEPPARWDELVALITGNVPDGIGVSGKRDRALAHMLADVLHH